MRITKKLKMNYANIWQQSNKDFENGRDNIAMNAFSTAAVLVTVRVRIIINIATK